MQIQTNYNLWIASVQDAVAVFQNMLLINKFKRHDYTNSVFIGCSIVIFMLIVLQADSETSRCWHLFREMFPKAVTSCLDQLNPTERERQRRNYMLHGTHARRKTLYSLFKISRYQLKFLGRHEEGLWMYKNVEFHECAGVAHFTRNCCFKFSVFICVCFTI